MYEVGLPCYGLPGPPKHPLIVPNSGFSGTLDGSWGGIYSYDLNLVRFPDGPYVLPWNRSQNIIPTMALVRMYPLGL